MQYKIIGVLVMAVVSYIPRVIPILFINKKIKSPFILAFLHYMPYAVLASISFPDILYISPGLLPAIIGLLCAFIMSFLGFDLVIVAVASTAAVYISSLT